MYNFKLNKIALISCFLLLILEIFLFLHYKRLGVKENFFGFLFVINLGIVLFFYSIQKWKDFINPISLYFIFIFGFGYSMLDISTLVKPWDYLSFSILLLSILSYFIGARSNIGFISPFNFIRIRENQRHYLYYFILLISFFSFIYEISQIGYIPIFRIFSFDVYNDPNMKFDSFIHYFVLLFSVIPSWTYILYKNEKLSKRFYVIVLILSCFVILNFLSRTILILLLISIPVTYNFYHKINIKKLLFFGVGLILIFFIVGQIRMNQMSVLKNENNYTANDFLRTAGGIKYKTNLVESTYTIYSSLRYSEFNKYIHKARYEEYSGDGKFIFRSLVNLMLLDKIGIVKYESRFNVNSAIATYAIDPYLDFGVIGVILWGIGFGLLAKHFYLNYKSGIELYIVPWSITIFCLIMTPFINYLSSFFVLFVWLLNKLIIGR